MKKYINFNYKYNSSVVERIGLIKDAGFDGVFVYSQYNPEEYIPAILDSGLEIETLHLPYKLMKDGVCLDSKYVNVIWTSKSEAESYVTELMGQIDLAATYKIPTVVMHVTGGSTPPPICQLGIDRIKKILEYCEDRNINLCLENLRCLEYIQTLFENVKSSYLGFCFDTGHANYMTKNVTDFPWQYFGSRLFCLHLNDNTSIHDSHAIPLSGNIDWAPLMNTIFSFRNSINLTLEVRANEQELSTISEYEFLKRGFDSLVVLESLKKG